MCVWGWGWGTLPMFGHMGISLYGIYSIMHVTSDKDTRLTNTICSVNALLVRIAIGGQLI